MMRLHIDYSCWLLFYMGGITSSPPHLKSIFGGSLSQGRHLHQRGSDQMKKLYAPMGFRSLCELDEMVPIQPPPTSTHTMIGTGGRRENDQDSITFCPHHAVRLYIYGCLWVREEAREKKNKKKSIARSTRLCTARLQEDGPYRSGLITGGQKERWAHSNHSNVTYMGHLIKPYWHCTRLNVAKLNELKSHLLFKLLLCYITNAKEFAILY